MKNNFENSATQTLNRMKFIVLFSLLLLFISGAAQKTERFTGDFYNGIKINGTANYSFYTNEQNQKIKHGAFRYSAREKSETWRYSHSITGSYSKGLKEGSWNYLLTSKDFEKDQEGHFYNIDVSMTAEYSNGYPNGRWVYQCKISKHKKENKQGRIRNTASQVTTDVHIVLNWKNGVLIDSLIIDDAFQQNISLVMNNNGFLDGNYHIKSKDQSKNKNTIYEAGILKKTYNGSKSNLDTEYSCYTSLPQASEKVKMTKESLFKSKPKPISDYLNTHIFNSDYFMYRYIDGDKILKRDKKFGDYSVKYKGLYYYNLSPIMDAEENVIISEINSAYQKLKQADAKNKYYISKYPNDKQYQDKQRYIKTALSSFNKINCHISSYRKYLSLQKTTAMANQSCSPIKNTEGLKKKTDYLQLLKDLADYQINILKTHQILK